MTVRKWLSRVTRGTMVIFVVAVCLPAALTAGAGFAADSTKSTVKPPPGALKPVPATGMGTPAAMDDPRCNVGTGYSVYGNWNTSTIGSGPACVRPMKKGEKNGGATAPGVTATSVKVVAVIPSAERSDSPDEGCAADLPGEQLPEHVGERGSRLPVRVPQLL